MTCSGTRQLNSIESILNSSSTCVPTCTTAHICDFLRIDPPDQGTDTLTINVFLYTPPSFCIASCWFPWGGSGPKNFRILKSHWRGQRKTVQEERDRWEEQETPGRTRRKSFGARSGRGGRPLKGCRGQREECVRARRKKKLWVQGLM